MYADMLERAQKMERDLTAEINRLAALRERARGQVDLLVQLIAMENAHAHPDNAGQPGAAGAGQPGRPVDNGAGHADPDYIADPDPAAAA